MKLEDIKSVIRTGEGQTMKWTKDEKKRSGIQTMIHKTLHRKLNY